MTKRARRNHNPAFKVKVALAQHRTVPVHPDLRPRPHALFDQLKGGAACPTVTCFHLPLTPPACHARGGRVSARPHNHRARNARLSRERLQAHE